MPEEKKFKEIPSDIILKEDIDINIVTALMRNYRNAIEAILELIDNAVDDRIEGSLLKIEILLGPKLIVIRNSGGYGMGLRELQDFLKWGRSFKRGKLGRYGQGGKAALGYLGRSWKLTASKLGEEKTYIIEENNWRDRIAGRKKYKPKILEGLIPTEEGVVSFEIRDLSRKINDKKLREALSDYYRMLLEENKVIIEINREIVKPLKIPLIKKERIVEKLEGSKKFHGWIGLLPRNAGIRGGIRCCVLGRKITENEYFGHPDYTYKATLNRIIGEINADFLELNLNKTGFDRDSWGWIKVKERMYDRMKPFIESLLKEEEEESVTEEEKKKHERASEIWNKFMEEYLNKEGAITTEALKKEEFDLGQKPPEKKKEERAKEESLYSRAKYKPATPPPEIAIGRRKRLKRFLGIKAEPGIIPDKSIRSELQIKDNREIILINKLFPAYKKRKGDSLYIWETIAMECAKPEKEEEMDYIEYIREFGKIYSSFCLYLEKNKIKT